MCLNPMMFYILDLALFLVCQRTHTSVWKNIYNLNKRMNTRYKNNQTTCLCSL